MFFLPNIDGFIAYRLESNSAIVFGEPTCAEADRPLLTQAFHRFIEEQGKNVIYISVCKDFAYWAIENGCSTLVEFGKALVLDPTHDPMKESGKHGSLVRRKVRSAIRDKVLVQEYLSHEPSLRQAMIDVGDKWLSARRGTQMHISNIHLFEDVEGKRWFYAKQDEKIVGVVCLNELQKHQGWHLNHLMMIPNAPHGTSELLVTTALKTVNNEGCRYVSLGIVTPKKLGVMIGLNGLSKWIAHIGFRIARIVARLDGSSAFWGNTILKNILLTSCFLRKTLGFAKSSALREL